MHRNCSNKIICIKTYSYKAIHTTKFIEHEFVSGISLSIVQVSHSVG